MRREIHLKHAQKQKLIKASTKGNQLHIVYVMTHVGICGGTKIILEHVNHLIRCNQSATIINNAIDTTIFYHDTVKEEKQDFTLMMIGSENNEFKGISDIMQALSILEELGYRMKLVWVIPNKPIQKTWRRRLFHKL